MHCCLKGLDSIIDAICQKQPYNIYYLFWRNSCFGWQCIAVKKGFITYPRHHGSFPHCFFGFLFPEKKSAFYYSYSGFIWRFVFTGSYLFYQRKYFCYCTGNRFGGIGYCCKLFLHVFNHYRHTRNMEE